MEFPGMPPTFPRPDGIQGEIIPPPPMNPNMMGGEGYQDNMEHMYPHPGGERSEYTHHHSVFMDGGSPYGVSCMTFDTQELLWAGTQSGHVTSYYGSDMQKYTSFHVHASNDIRQILTLENGILSLTKNSMRLSVRRGFSIMNYIGDGNLQDMQCMMATGPHSVLMGGHQTKVIEVDLNKGIEVNQFEVKEPGCAIFRHSSKYICAGDTSGRVTLYDPQSMKAEHVLEAHTGTLSDFDLHDHLLVTCGFSNRMGNLQADRFLKVYDMRVMRAVAPIQVSIDPTFLRFVPNYSNKLAVVSQVGHFQLVDPNNTMSNSSMFYQVNTGGAVLTSFDISSSCNALSFGDSSGYIHLYTNRDHPTFNAYSQPTEFPDPVEPVQSIHINDELAPVSMVPMVYPPSGQLLSDWQTNLSARKYRKPKPIDPEILRTMKVYHNVGYAPNSGKERRNQIPYKLPKEVHMQTTGGTTHTRKSSVPESPLGRGEDPFVTVPKKYRRVEMKYSKLGLEDFDFRHYNKTHFAGLETHIPNAYCNAMLQVLYFLEPLRCHLLSHLCHREFCLSCELGFLYHMLDTQKGQTCQASNFLRAFRTIPEASALGLCLSEAEEAAGKVNLPRLIQSWQRFVLQQVHSETAVKLESDTKSGAAAPAETSTEAATTEKKEQTPSKSKKKKKKGKKKEESKDEAEAGDSNGEDNVKASEDVSEEPARKEEVSKVTELFGIKTNLSLKCRCSQETSRDNDLTLINLSYPDCNIPGQGPRKYKFSEVIQHSLMGEGTMQAWCNECGRYQQHTQRRALKNLPDVLALNCQLENEKDLNFWRLQHEIVRAEDEENQVHPATSSRRMAKSCRYGSACKRKDCKFKHDPEHDSILDELLEQVEDEETSPKWLPLGLRMGLNDDGTVRITEVSDEEPLPKIEDEKVKHYELYATVTHVHDKTGGNLVSHILVGEEFHQRKEKVTCTQWYLFNDFSITPIEKYEAIHFNLDWKVPCAIYFVKRNLTRYHDLTVTNQVGSDCIFNDLSLMNPKRRKMTFTPLQPDDLPKAKEIVGLDAEFVSLKEEESELRSDGTRSTIKPSHMAVARITCIRGQGPQFGEPFIDDYIANPEQVVDYLTQYSGIKPGDLDAAVSTKHLTTLKSTYQKLRYLIDAGVVFVGHGLKKDFRVINILVRKDQVTDTVELFHLPRQRMISLKFLAWYFLKINIQSFTHDSVEDAITALKLQQKYKELQDEGEDKVQGTIKEMYEFGRKCQWKIPDVDENYDEQVAFL
ncbi:PAN2-PAN3 deadenylation complex catalytic subunit Pan2-like isoform X1 [Haliotis rufescens]|uniref:PAN2-PAN3 deadenylation complex catalytic subunit Pan2-like isoform X1 n=1 Tax=Haliotis rufescens TaxID=6454 RepID=UPI00201EFB4C|nr:PAN2-PAN3 deadenylation complex catalytic subunit Pan2-like isoform X1 [Haliotis rufescens]XP_048246746.1 PAN2-PAN3 deadenylation complex catalytic subunit Pan2-like isoform X1 [Haliotis rufescens]XP_048246748.1 PAN2-PAN3 deadenylation complex catalytic subunit Pan2-like isoform X1 [Haliotis rufescens]